ncbi:hypothetical protein D3C85_965380 [compost metagenome]
MTVLKGSIYKNQEGESFEVVAIKSENDIKVRFIKTGYECRAREHIVKQGLVRDFTKFEDERDSWEPYEEHFTNNSGESFVSVLKRGRRIKVIFEPNYLVEVDINNARAGKVKNPYSISVYDQGYIGQPDKSLEYCKQAFQLWQNMMKRCYSEKDSRGYFGKCFVDERWKCFENFLNDIQYLEGFNDWLKGSDNTYFSSNLDKDFYIKGNDLYSRHYCRFLPQGYNKSLGKKNKTEKDWA